MDSINTEMQYTTYGALVVDGECAGEVVLGQLVLFLAEVDAAQAVPV